MLVDGEKAFAAYKTLRDSAIFTHRLIVRDAQGLRGKKVEVYSLPYAAVHVWSSENASGVPDFNAELELWTRAGHIKVNLNKGIDIRRLDRLIAEAALGSSADDTSPPGTRATASARAPRVNVFPNDSDAAALECTPNHE